MERGRLDTDVFVVGGGPAGLAAAIAARQEGFRVGIADPGEPPLDKACGEGLMPAGVTALRKLGVTLGLNDGVPFRGIRFAENGTTVQADFPDGWGRGVRRTTLHKLLVQRAWRAGVEMNWGVRVTCGQSGTVYINGSVIRSRWVIGADGHNSRVRNWAGLGADFAGLKRYGFRGHYRVAPWSEHVEVHWTEDCELYVTPTGAQDICIAALTANPRLRLAEALAKFPEVAKKVENAEIVGSEMGGVCMTRSLRAVFRENVALTGDASGSVDAVTGDGLALAMQQAISLAKALRKNDLRAYANEHRQMMQLPRMMSRLLVLLSKHGWLRRRLLSALSANPMMFSRLLAAHAGTMNLTRLVLDYAPAFTWQVLTARDAASSSEIGSSRFDRQ
ncbi:MAG TPA: NAD(P)/FAD-dependent oxidoreductase [Candidatus Acidoferrales bacterium]|nr:NAD(P)/FAD-dependent oxidoreductase [Candidatus Acidoferrales bacterium]